MKVPERGGARLQAAGGDPRRAHTKSGQIAQMGSWRETEP
jgi:hypothetical protein